MGHASLLRGDDDSEADDVSLTKVDIAVLDLQHRNRTLRLRNYFLASLNVVLLVVCAILALDAVKAARPLPGCRSYSLAGVPSLDHQGGEKHHHKLDAAGAFPSLADSDALQYEDRVLDVKLHDNPFTGPPRPDLDLAWHELFESELTSPSSFLLSFERKEHPLHTK